MDKTFRTFDGKRVIDVVDHINDRLKMNENASICVGCDSHNMNDETVFVCVIVLHDVHSGGHVLFSKDIFPKINDMRNRLYKEVEISLDVSLFLRDSGFDEMKFIDVDVNTDSKYKSSEIFGYAESVIEYYGFEPRFKPNAACASKVADKICHKQMI